MKPWSHDAGELNPNEITTAYIYKNPIIEEYLRPDSHERKLFLIGSKGCGKTLLLRYKAYLYWKKMEADDQEGFTVSASNELVESLDFNLVTLSRSDLEKLANSEKWAHIWNFSLALIILRRSRIGLPPKHEYIDDDFPPTFRLNNIVTEIINNPHRYINSKYFGCINHLMAQLNNLQHPFVLFVDRLDQALNTLLINEDYKYFEKEGGENIPFKVWQCAQYGLLESSYNFTTAINRHVKIFATARQEALGVETQLRPNITSFCTNLDYNKSELKKIFEQNIRHTPKEFLQPQTDDPYLKFFGFDKMEHLKAKNENQERQEEHIFDFLLRHTFARPREIVLMGRIIYEQLITRQEYHERSLMEKIESVRRRANDTSHERILRDYLTEVVPAFHREYLDECAQKFEQNLIHHQDLKQVDDEIINYLYRIGLIGYERNGKQHFLSASKHIHDKLERIPKAGYYLLHPTLDGILQQIRNYDEFYNEYNIIGDGYPFHSPPLYSSNRVKQQDVEYYMPVRLPGKNNGNPWQSAKIQVDPKKLFTVYFLQSEDPEWVDLREKKINAAFKVLTIIANLLFLEKVESHFRIDFSQWRNELLTSLGALRGRTEYSTTISSLDDHAMKIMEARVFGRLIAAGLLAYPGADYSTVDHILKTFSYNSNHRGNDEHAVKYLRQAFFLAGLRNTQTKDKQERETILSGLSPFEKDHLHRWWFQYINHDLMSNGHFTREQRDFLENLLDDVL